MLRQLAARLPLGNRAAPSSRSSTTILRRAGGLSLPKRSMATVSVEGIPKVRPPLRPLLSTSETPLLTS